MGGKVSFFHKGWLYERLSKPSPFQIEQSRRRRSSRHRQQSMRSKTKRKGNNPLLLISLSDKSQKPKKLLPKQQRVIPALEVQPVKRLESFDLDLTQKRRSIEDIQVCLRVHSRYCRLRSHLYLVCVVVSSRWDEHLL